MPRDLQLLLDKLKDLLAVHGVRLGVDVVQARLHGRALRSISTAQHRR